MLIRAIFCSLLVIQTGYASTRDDKIFVLKQSEDGLHQSQLLIVSWSPDGKDGIGGCEMFDDETLIQQVLNSKTGTPVIETTDDNELQSMIKDCTEVSMRKRRDAPNGQSSEESPDEDTEDIYHDDDQAHGAASNGTDGYSGWNVIFPGTKWCGAGDIAKDYNDLGFHSDTDKCCRAHDLCNDTLAPGESKNGLENTSPFTTLSCQCDNDFYDCLSNVDSMISNKIGNMYFNLLRRQCYEENYPLTRKCKTYRTFMKFTCKEYARNTKAPKVYQWRPPKLYKKLPFPGPITVTLPF